MTQLSSQLIDCGAENFTCISSNYFTAAGNRLNCWGNNKKVISLQKFLGNSHKGFDPLRTDDSDQDFDDSDQEEYSAPPRLTGKA